MQAATILVGADLVPTSSNIEFFCKGEVEKLIGTQLMEILSSADARIFNLECPLTDTLTPLEKCGPNLIARTLAIKGIKALNPTVIGLANNHILDQNEQGLFSTIDQLIRHDISFVGVGHNLEEAKKPHIISSNEINIGVYACAENEFAIATKKKSGANPFDPLESLDHIQELRTECDYVIVIYHGGKEHYRYPSPGLQKVCRKMVDKGADIVICQHSHCIGAFEKYSGSTILYGQGNFIFDASDEECWQTSLLLRLTFSDKVNVEYIPICKKNNRVELANAEQKQTVLAAFFARSQQITESDFIENEYEKICASMGKDYLKAFAGYSKMRCKIDNLLKGIISRKTHDKDQLLTLRNYIECEAHRELILTYIKSMKG